MMNDEVAANSLMLTWNPATWTWHTFADDWQKIRAGVPVERDWKCKTAKPRPGDRFYLVLQGDGHRGVMGSGRVIAPPFPGIDPLNGGAMVQLVRVSFDVLLNPDKERILTRDELLHIDPRPQFWGVAHSGSMFQADIARHIARAWNEFLARHRIPSSCLSITFAEEITSPQRYVEGATTMISVNAYERSPEARTACIAHYGARCQVCGLDFHRRYGDIGKDFIHVHHLKPLSDIGEQYEVDPIQDLRPVCPNCHAMLHRQTPPLTIEALRHRMEQCHVQIGP